MIHQRRRLFLLIGLTGLLISCNPTPPSPPSTPPSPQTQLSPAAQTQVVTAASNSEKIQFKLAAGQDIFALKPQANGAKLVDGNNQEIARLTVDPQQKVKIKNPADQAIGYVTQGNNAWKIKDASQKQDLYILRRQADGDYKLESGNDRQVYRIKQRDYGLEIETPAKQSLYKIRSKDGKLSLRNAAGETVLYTKAKVAPIVLACFGLDELSSPQKAALAYAVSLTTSETSGGQ